VIFDVILIGLIPFSYFKEIPTNILRRCCGSGVA